MAITGTGTQADPYVPTTFEDLISVATSDSVYITLPEGGGTYDMNDYYPEGITSEVPLRGTIEGNNWVIKNAAALTAGVSAFRVSNNKEIRRLHFLNFRLQGSSTSKNALLRAFTEVTASSLIQECKFSGMAENGSVFSGDFRASSRINRCAFNLEFQKNGSFGNNNLVRFYYCNFNIKDFDTTTSDRSFRIYNCYLTGNLTRNLDVNLGVDSILDIDVADGKLIKATDNNNPVTNVLVNNTKYGGTVPSRMTGVSTEDLSNAAKLRNIYGFPVEVSV